MFQYSNHFTLSQALPSVSAIHQKTEFLHLQWISCPSNSKMNKSTSQPHLNRQDLDELENSAQYSDWLCRQPESQQIRQFKVVVRNLPYVQRHNWQKHKWPNKGVQSLSNLECIVENSLESDQEFANSPADSRDNLDSVRSEQPIRTDQFGKPIELAERALDSRGSEVLDSRTSDSRPSNSRASDRGSESRMLDSRASDRVVESPRRLPTNEPNEVHSIATISRLSSQLYQTNRQASDQNALNSNEPNNRRLNANYQSNLNTFNSQSRSKRSNYKQVNTTDDNFFFGSANQEYERSVSSTASNCIDCSSIAVHSDLASSIFLLSSRTRLAKRLANKSHCDTVSNFDGHPQTGIKYKRTYKSTGRSTNRLLQSPDAVRQQWRH